MNTACGAIKESLTILCTFLEMEFPMEQVFFYISLHRENLTQLFDQKKSDSSIINKFCYEWGSKVLIDMEQLTSFFGNFKSESSQFKAVKSLTASLQGLLHRPLIFIFNEVVKKINPEQSFCFHFLLEEKNFCYCSFD